MFEVAAPRFRALNANLLLFAVQAGFFFGPVLGGALVARHGYRGYFRFSIGLALLALTLSALLARQQRRGSVHVQGA
jgi:MFS family permease